MQRRTFLKFAGLGVAGGVAAPVAGASTGGKLPGDTVGMLVDTTVCVGCRKCEYACAQANELSDAPLESFEDQGVYETFRRPDEDAFTVLNRYDNPADPEKPFFAKVQCMHCLHPACVSACIVGALEQSETGAVVYDAWKCIGCRYCMVACPFQIPAYEYHDALAPKVRKCYLCSERAASEGQMPACAEMCPPMAITFGTRDELLKVAHAKIAADPDRYHPHVYGEHEVGGTSWMYLTAVPAEELGFPKFGEEPIPALTETIQHSIFRYGAIPAMVFGVLGATMKAFTPEDGEHDDGSSTE